MPEIKTNTLSFLVNGKTVEVKKASKLNFELNKALLTDEGFQSFANDPKSFAKKFDLEIDQQLSDQLKGKLGGLKSLKDLHAAKGGGESDATVWAVAGGSYSVATSKIAVAF